MKSKIVSREVNDILSIELDQSDPGAKLEEQSLGMFISAMNSLSDAGAVLEQLPESKRSLRFRAVLAQDLRVKIALHNLVRETDLLLKITTGDEQIEDHGFPEFQDD